MVPCRTAICGKAPGDMSIPPTNGATTSRACGPCTAITAHCSVTEVRKTSGPPPQRDILKHRAVLRRPWVYRRLPDRVEQCATRRPDQCAKGDRRVGRPECRRADVRDRTSQRLRDDLERRHVRSLALIG